MKSNEIVNLYSGIVTDSETQVDLMKAEEIGKHRLDEFINKRTETN